MGEWRALIEELLAGTTSPAAFHDGFFRLWRRDRDTGLPEPIERLFDVVEAFTPDPALRDASQPWEADEGELRQAAERAPREMGTGDR
jgi:hypothetical protein